MAANPVRVSGSLTLQPLNQPATLQLNWDNDGGTLIIVRDTGESPTVSLTADQLLSLESFLTERRMMLSAVKLAGWEKS